MSIRTDQLGAWSGEFGKQYTERNQISWEARKPHFEGIVKGLSLGSVLEVGCNRGHNLVALQSIVGEGTARVGIEPMPQNQRERFNGHLKDEERLSNEI